MIFSGICGGIKSHLNIGDFFIAETILYKNKKIFLEEVPFFNSIYKVLEDYKKGKMQTFDFL